jgi:hypothetical protein
MPTILSHPEFMFLNSSSNHFNTRCRQDGNHLASFGINCVCKLYNNIDITLDTVVITNNINILEFGYQMLRKL